MEFFSALADILGAEVGQIIDFIIEGGVFFLLPCAAWWRVTYLLCLFVSRHKRGLNTQERKGNLTSTAKHKKTH